LLTLFQDRVQIGIRLSENPKSLNDLPPLVSALERSFSSNIVLDVHRAGQSFNSMSEQLQMDFRNPESDLRKMFPSLDTGYGLKEVYALDLGL
jgi:hypothetical protein